MWYSLHTSSFDFTSVLDACRTGEMGLAYVTGLQSGHRRNVSSTAIARMATTCKHFAAFGSPQGGLYVDFDKVI